MQSPQNTAISFDYPQQNAAGATCTAQAWAKTPPHLHGDTKAVVIERIKALLIENDAALVARILRDKGIDPLEERRRSKAAKNSPCAIKITFEQFANEWIEIELT